MSPSENSLSRQRDSLLIGFGGLLLFTLGFWNQPFIEFEARFALFAQEMMRHGISLFPTAYGEPYPDYPATSTLFILLPALTLGGVTKLAAILPTAIASAINLVITYRLLARFSRHWGWFAVGFQILTVTFLAEARSISLDQMIATVTVCSFYIAYANGAPRHAGGLLALSALLVLGFAIRGPLGLVIPAGVVCSYYALSAQWRRLIIFGGIAAFLLALCWGGLLLASRQIYGTQFMQDVIHMQVAGRLEMGEHLQRWYYLTSSVGNYALAYPVALLVAIAAFASRRYEAAPLPFLLYLVGWVLVVIAGLSIPEAKKARYLLPMVPAIAALAAYPLAISTRPDTRRIFRWIAVALENLFLILPLLAAIAMALATHRLHKQAPSAHLSLPAIYASLAALQVGALALRWRYRAQARTLGLLLNAALTVWTLNFLIAEPLALQLHDTRKFVELVEAQRKLRPADIVFFKVGKDSSAIKYVANLNYDLRPQFVDKASAIDALTGSHYIIARDKDLPELMTSTRLQNLQPAVHDRFDHDLYSAFYLHD